MSSSSPCGLSAERLSFYAGLAMGTGLVAAANADVISSTGGIVAQATVDTTMNGATYNSTGPSSGYWQFDQKRVHDTFTMAGVTMQIEAFNLRTNGSPRLIGGKMNGTGFQAMATGYAYGGAWASKLASGAMIGTANQSFGSFSFYGVRGFGQRADGGSASYQSANFNNDPANWSPIFNAPFEGEFIDATGESRGFAGIRLTGAGGVGVDFYGWLDIGFDHTTGTLTVYAWGYDDSGAPIIAGQTGGGGAVPGLGGLAALACGAAGVRGRRHRVA